MSLQQRPILVKAYHISCWLLILFALGLEAASVSGQEAVHPLQPPDRSSPRAALKTFLDGGDAVGAYLAQDYIPSPSHAKFKRLLTLGEVMVQSLDLSQAPPVSRQKTGRAAALALYGVLSRIRLPAFNEIPDHSLGGNSLGTNSTRWTIPHTPIVLERNTGGDYLFSADTVAKANLYYAKVHDLAYTRKVPLPNMKDIVMVGGGWMVPYAWIQALPPWLRAPVADQAGWKWLGLFLILTVFALCLMVVYRFSRRGSPQHPFLHALAQSVLPAFILLATPLITYLALVQLNMIEGVGIAISLAATAIVFLAGAWSSWRLAPVFAEAIIASPNIAPESIDAHLIRITTRLLGMVGAAALLAIGADRMGIPVYGIVAGLGVGGLAIALAAQPTIENLIGGLNLFADRPIRVGDLCQCGTDAGTVESIGIRSTRIRGNDRTLTSIPNAALSKMSIINLTQRDRLLIKSVLGVRYETSPEQLRCLLAKIRELLLSHPRIDPDSARARFIGFGASSLDIEVHAYVMTREWPEFLAVREDVWLRIMDIVNQVGTGFAFPSQTLYLARDGGLDPQRTEEAQNLVRRWREEGQLPFPSFTQEQLAEMLGKLDYPPVGSPCSTTLKRQQCKADAGKDS